jgi:hypothetical protein
MTGKHSISPLEDFVSCIESSVPREEIESLLERLEKGNFGSITKDLESLRIAPHYREKLQSLLKDRGDRADVLAICLALSHSLKRVERPSIEICLTHPIEGVHERMIWPAMSEIILATRQALIVAGYEITGNPEVIFQRIREKSEEGVELTFLINRLEEKESFINWAKTLRTPPELFSFRGEPSDPISSLHIKCIISDDNVAVVGSANPTYHGLMKNIEIFLIIRDREVVGRLIKIIGRLKQELIHVKLQE